MKKRKMILFTAIALFLMFSGMGCEKKVLTEQLPPETQTGANTFGCLFNGKVFTPNEYIGFMMPSGGGGPISVYGYYHDTENYSNMIYAVRSSNITNIQYIHVYIYRMRLNGVGSYKTGDKVAYHTHYHQPFCCYISCRAVSPTTGQYKFYGSYANSGEINVTRCDNEKRIYSGTFNATLKEDGGDEIVHITEGRFDLNLHTLNDN